MKRVSRWLTLGAVAVLACRPIDHDPAPPSPANECPTYPCSAYPGSAGTPSCVEGACVEPAPWSSSDLVIVVGLPAAAFTAPGRSCPMRLGDLVAQLRPLPADACSTTPCRVQIPIGASVSGNYTVLRSNAQLIGAMHFNGSGDALTSLPVHVTYRALWPPDATSAANDAFGAGLAIFPFEATPNTNVALYPGPNGPSEGFQTSTPQRLDYERTITPDAPFDEEIPPDVNIVSEPSPDDAVVVQEVGFDTTVGQDGTGTSFPVYNLTRDQAPMDGWKAYLRDATTKRPISPMKTLSGKVMNGVTLATHHHPPDGDAVKTNVELVIAPSDPSLPTEFSSFPFVFDQSYPDLPSPKEVFGTIQWTGEAPPAADVVFEAQKVYVGFDAAAGQGSPSDGGPSDDAGGSVTTFQAQPNFEFTTDVTVRPDASGLWTFSAQIPRGKYRVIIRPDDAGEAGPAIANAVTIVDDVDTLDGTEQNPDVPLNIPLQPSLATAVQGTATITDGRPLSSATVEAIPLACPATTSDSGNAPKDTARCLPRYGETSTDDQGHFSLALDPGDYVLKVEPPGGSRLPWTWRTISISPGTSDQVEYLAVPAPAHLQMQLVDPGNNHFVTNAVVQVYTAPTATQKAVEIARSVTDGSGTFDVYLAPSVQ